MAESSLDAAPSWNRSGDETLASDGESSRRASAVVVPDVGTQVGRYLVLAKLGAGAMGVVLAAYDPELDRKVALKLLKVRGGDREAARARLQREAQALAKLSHPNVVAVHDVGEHEGQVFVAMEFVAGATLRQWRDVGRSWHQIVEVMLAAGRGLAAAHAQGMVHRDFKPDNVMIGDDGRVRVMDFGLARAQDGEDSMEAKPSLPVGLLEEPSASKSMGSRRGLGSLTRTGSLMGTPAYMAPEQFGGRTTAASDQYAFCVTLYEALYGERPTRGETLAELAFEVTSGEVRPPPRGTDVPGWLGRIVQRGLALDPEERFASMAGLLAELAAGEGQRRRRRRGASVAVAAVAVAGVVGLWRYEHSMRVAACEAEGDAIDEIWNEEVRGSIARGLAGAGVDATTTSEKITPWIDENAESWRTNATTACMNATVLETWDHGTWDKARWCLEERRLNLAWLLEAVSDPSRTNRWDAVDAFASLPLADACTSPVSLGGMAAPPSSASASEVRSVLEEHARLKAMAFSGQYEEGIEGLPEVRERADALGWASLVASSYAVEAHLTEVLGRFGEAEAAGVTAYTIAAKAGAWDVAADAASNLIYTVGYQQRRIAEAERWAEHAEVAITHAGDPFGIREASRLSNLGAVLWVDGDFEGALETHRAALERWEAVVGPEHPQVISSVNNLASARWKLGRVEDARKDFERVLAARERSLGREHPKVATALNNLGRVAMDEGDFDGAVAMLEEARGIWSRTLGARHPNVATASLNLGTAYRDAEQLERAREWFQDALEIREQSRGPTDLSVEYPLWDLANIERELGRLPEALVMYERCLAIFQGAKGGNHIGAMGRLVRIADVLRELGRLEQARDRYQRALEIWEANGSPVHKNVPPALVGLGRAHAALGEHEAAARALERLLGMPPGDDVAKALLARARFELAKARFELAGSDGDQRSEARALAEEAERTAAEAGEDAAELRAEVSAWLAEHP